MDADRAVRAWPSGSACCPFCARAYPQAGRRSERRRRPDLVAAVFPHARRGAEQPVGALRGAAGDGGAAAGSFVTLFERGRRAGHGAWRAFSPVRTVRRWAPEVAGRLGRAWPRRLRLRATLSVELSVPGGGQPQRGPRAVGALEAASPRRSASARRRG